MRNCLGKEPGQSPPRRAADYGILRSEHDIIFCPVGVLIGILQVKVIHQITQTVAASPTGVDAEFWKQLPADCQGVNSDVPQLQELVAPKHGV